MKIGCLQLLWGTENHRTILKFDKRLSDLDVKRIKEYVSGGYHTHRNHPKKGKPSANQVFNVAPPKSENSRHTPEELDRLIEVVRDANSPSPKEGKDNREWEETVLRGK